MLINKYYLSIAFLVCTLADAQTLFERIKEGRKYIRPLASIAIGTLLWADNVRYFNKFGQYTSMTPNGEMAVFKGIFALQVYDKEGNSTLNPEWRVGSVDSRLRTFDLFNIVGKIAGAWLVYDGWQELKTAWHGEDEEKEQCRCRCRKRD